MSVHTGNPTEVVVAEGTALRVTDAAALDDFVSAYNPKYGWNFDATTEDVINGVVAVVPDVVLAWVTTAAADSSPGTPFPSAGAKWVFPTR